MYPVKNATFDLRAQYRRILEISLVVSLIIHIFVFRAIPELKTTQHQRSIELVEIVVQDMPQTEQMKRLPPPKRPAIPVPTESEDVPEDLTIESTEINIDLVKIPPPPERDSQIEDGYVFVPYDEPPQPIGGLGIIHKHIKYPEIARKAGIEATVLIGVLVSETGQSLKTQIIKSSGTELGFEQAAHDAVMKVKWKPAKQRDLPVKVWISFPIRFKLTTPPPLT